MLGAQRRGSSVSPMAVKDMGEWGGGHGTWVILTCNAKEESLDYKL